MERIDMEKELARLRGCATKLEECIDICQNEKDTKMVREFLEKTTWSEIELRQWNDILTWIMFRREIIV